MSRQIVRASYTTYITWKIPAGIDLEDKETYGFADKWGTLYIWNKKTGEEFKIKDGETWDHDQKRSDHLEVLEADSEGVAGEDYV